MTDNEIIKALECCVQYTTTDVRTYKGMPLEVFSQAVLDLINRQAAEIDNLRKAKVVFETVDYCEGDLTDALEEIDRLKIENESLRMAGNSLKIHLKKAEAEIERLRENKIIVEEMTGGENDD